MNASEPPADSEHDIVSSRVFEAAREVVFDAFRDPEKLAHWWGPEGFTNTFHEFDFRPGGRWRFTMHGPNSTAYQNAKDFIEVVPRERIVFQHLEPVQHRFRMTMTFAAEAGKTRLTWRMRFESAAEGTKFRDFILGANEENFDRLEALLKRNR